MVKGNDTAPTKADLNKANVKKAIARGKEMAKGGSTKADISRKIYDLVKDESREVILYVFQHGAGLTEKGSLTYLYNVKRKLSKPS